MPLYNPYRNFDKGMEDAYLGNEPQMNDKRYLEGYEYSQQLLNEEIEQTQTCSHKNIIRQDGLDECQDCGAKNY